MCCSYFFSVLTLFIGRQEGIQRVKKSCTSSPRGYLLKDLWGTGLSWIDMVKIGWIEKKSISLLMCCQY